MTDSMDGNGPKGPDHKDKTLRGKPRPKAGNNRSRAAALNLATIDGIPVRDKGTKKTIDRILKDDSIEPREYQPARGLSPKGLTAKQEAFAVNVAQGMTLSAAYRAAYDAKGMADGSVWTQASTLASSPKVAGRIKALDSGLKPKAPHDPVEVKAKIIKTLTSILEDEDAKTPDRMKAAELLGRWAEVALFDDRSTLRVETQAPEVAIEQLREKLAKLKAS